MSKKTKIPYFFGKLQKYPTFLVPLYL